MWRRCPARPLAAEPTPRRHPAIRSSRPRRSSAASTRPATGRSKAGSTMRTTETPQSTYPTTRANGFGKQETKMKKVVLVLAALITAFAGGASADYLSADLAGAGGEGFASLTTEAGAITYTILTADVGTPTGAAILQGGASVLDLQADFQFGAAAGSVTAAGALITQIENNASAYTLVVQTAGGTLTGTLQNAGDSGRGCPGPTPPPGVLRFTVDSANAIEGQTLTIQVSRTGGSSGAVSVSYATASGTAASGTDFTAANGTLGWADGDSASKSFTVPITNDTTEEQPESFTATLTNATGGA